MRGVKSLRCDIFTIIRLVTICNLKLGVLGRVSKRGASGFQTVGRAPSLAQSYLPCALVLVTL